MQNRSCAFYADGIDERGPYQEPLKIDLARFHTCYRQHMERHFA